MLVTSCTRALRLEIAPDRASPRLRTEHAPCRIGLTATTESLVRARRRVNVLVFSGRADVGARGIGVVAAADRLRDFGPQDDRLGVAMRGSNHDGSRNRGLVTLLPTWWGGG